MTTFNPYRFLSEDNSVIANRTIEIWDHDGSKLPDNVADAQLRLSTRTTEGRNTENYHKRKKRGELLPLTYFRQTEVKSEQEFQFDLKYSPTSYRQVCNWTTLGTFEPPTQESVNLKLGYDVSYFVQAAAAKIYSSGWDALTFMAELRQTVSMFRNFAKNLYSNASSGKLENIWLEGRYGWRTLLYDIEDINKMLQNVDTQRKRFRESVGTSIREREITTVPGSLGGAGTYDMIWTDEYYIGLRGTVVADITPPDFAFNPITTAWELKTLSFVTDWLVNVGQYLEAMSFLTFASQHYAAGGHEVTILRKGEITNVTPATNWSMTLSGSAEAYRRTTVRSPTQVSTNPLLQLRLDSFKVADLVALTVQALRGKS